ncbi:MAG: hypothetical protein K2N87_00725 [Eubacterium sp.]|nr:hypothetical protein [Eubacterium sp.]
MVDFGDAERRILGYFKRGTQIFHNGKDLIVQEAGKPTCPQGEPKTDIYVLASDNMNFEEIKISYKKKNADFLENKTNAERAEQLFGSDWRLIIKKSTIGIQDSFERRIRIYKERFAKAEKGAITLGWKFELMNKPSGELSGNMALTQDQIYDVYAGTNLSDDKRNAFVNGRRIQDSGIADYILVSDRVSSAQDIIDQMIPMEEYARMHPHIYFACKALNYRTFEKKFDGDRPLAVQVAWSIEDGKLVSELIFDSPLELNGNEMANRLRQCMKLLGIETTDDISSDNADMNHVNER